jgi:hypothetical protein
VSTTTARPPPCIPATGSLPSRDLETTQLLHIPEGAEGTVAEDRGSKLIVYFDDETSATNMEEKDLRRLPIDNDPAT